MRFDDITVRIADLELLASVLMNPRLLKEYHVFVSSPGDVDEERRAVRRYFEAFNISTAARWGVRFSVIDWENYSTIGVGRPQELITAQTLESFRTSLALVVGIMGQRFGSPTGVEESGTEEEFKWALDLNIATGFPEIKWFFKDLRTFQSPSDLESIKDALSQWEKVKSFQARFRTGTPPIFYSTYQDVDSFRDILSQDLALWLNDRSRPWFGEMDDDTPELQDKTPTAELPLSYYQGIVQNFQSLDIRGIDNDKAVDIPLSDIYVRLRVMHDAEADAPEEQLDEASDDEERREDRDEDLGELNIHEALMRFKRLVIVGDPGSGKSTFLKFIALTLAQSRILNDDDIAFARLGISDPLPIPIFISLWDLSDFLSSRKQSSDSSISEFIKARLHEVGIEMSTEVLEVLLDSGNCCVLFDGLDEVPTDNGRSLISRLVENFVAKFEDNRFVVTSRVRGYSGDAILKNAFVRCDIQDFSENDRSEFLENWFAAVLRVPKAEIKGGNTKGNVEFTELCRSIESKDRIRQLAVNPLLMTVIAIVHWNRKRLPDQRVELYDECVDVLLGQRKVAERTGRSHFSNAFDPGRENEIAYDRTWTRKRFGEVALHILTREESDEAARGSIVKILVPRFLDRGAEGEERAEYLAEKFLDNQELTSGLLVSRRSRSCRFVHLTFQEYLAAWNLANQSALQSQETIESKLREPRWFETLQLLGGELAKHSDNKLDEYVLFILNRLGASIKEKAPLIALCANILSDVSGIADISIETRGKYSEALKETLDAFRPNSGIPAKTQLEVLAALAQLGASVKDHLIQATKSAYFQVRSAALTLLVSHLSDDDLFGMAHIFRDRSQEPIWTYVKALVDRDEKRAIELVRSQQGLRVKSVKSLTYLLDTFPQYFSAEQAFDIIKRVIEPEYIGSNPNFTTLLQLAMSRWGLRDQVREFLMNRIETNARPGEAMEMLADNFTEDDSVWRYINNKIPDSAWAMYVIRRYPNKYFGTMEYLRELAVHSTVEWTRMNAFGVLAMKFTKPKSLERKLFGYQGGDWVYWDPTTRTVLKSHIESLATRYRVDALELRARIEVLTKDLPFRLEGWNC